MATALKLDSLDQTKSSSFVSSKSPISISLYDDATIVATGRKAPQRTTTAPRLVELKSNDTPRNDSDTMAALIELTQILQALQIAINAFMAKNGENESVLGKNEMTVMKEQQKETEALVKKVEEAKAAAKAQAWVMIGLQIFVGVILLCIPGMEIAGAAMLAGASFQIAQLECPENDRIDNWTGNKWGTFALKLGLTIMLSFASCGMTAAANAASTAASTAASAAKAAAEEALKQVVQNAEKAALEAAVKAGEQAAAEELAAAAEASLASAPEDLGLQQAAKAAQEAAEKAAEAAKAAADVAQKAESAVEAATKNLQAAEKAATEAAEKAAARKLASKEQPKFNYSHGAMALSSLNPIGSFMQALTDSLHSSDKTKEILSIVAGVITTILGLIAAWKGASQGANGKGAIDLLKLSPETQQMITDIMLKMTAVMNMISSALGIATGFTNLKKAQLQKEMAEPMEINTVLVLLAHLLQGQANQTSNWQKGVNNSFDEWHSLFAQLTESERAAAEALRA